MRWFASLVAVVLLVPGLALGGDLKVKGLAVWDTVQRSSGSWRNVKDAWQAIATGGTVDAFKGDAVISNGKIMVVIRQQHPDDAVQRGGVDLFAVKPGGEIARVRLRLLSNTGEIGITTTQAAVVENSKTALTLAATFRTAKGNELSAKFRLKRGDVHLQVEPGAGAGKLRVEAPSRFVILPDFWADDISIDATRLPLDLIELPSESFVLHPTGNGDSLAMCVFENRSQDVKVTLTGKGSARVASGTEIGFEKKKIWIALLEAPQIWHARDITAAETDKIINLKWRMPFPAQWRVDFTRAGDLTNSWEMLLQEQGYTTYVRQHWLGKNSDGVDYEVFAANRVHWNTVLGSYPYPCWSDAEGNGYVQPIKNRFLKFEGPAVIYPIHRIKDTPLDAHTVVDVMRATLGVGPCEHILDVQSHVEQYKGQATCGVRDILTPIYAKGKQKQRREEINKTLDDGLIFVKHIRSRIEDYVTFGRKARAYLAEQRKAHPDLAEFIDEMDALTAEIQKKYDARKEKIKSPEHVAKMNEDFRKNVLDYTGPDAKDRCKAYTHALWIIGDNQDELSGELRWVARALRQRAGIRMAIEPKATAIATEIRNRTQEVLRNPAWHEGARQ